MAESNARPHRLVDANGVPERIGKLPLVAARRMPTEVVDEIRRASNAEAPDAGVLQVGEYIDLTPEIATGQIGRYRIFRTSKGATYVSRDPDAGFRIYGRGGRTIKWWHGYLLTQAIDHFTGLPLEAHGFAADQNEYTHYTQIVEKAAATLGRLPYFVTSDKGHSIWSCFEWSVERGITLVAPYRRSAKGPRRAQATVDFDEHGVPFCRSCHGGTDQVGFHVEPAHGRNGRPRPLLRVRCAGPDSEACLGVQEWNCRRDPTRLLPVWRTHPAYTEARLMHMPFERAHNEARLRANAKPRHFETRSKRVSLKLATLRLTAYAVIAWLRASIINGWLGTPALNPELEAGNSRQRQLVRQTQDVFIQRRVIERRLRLGYVGGGRVPHRTRGAPTRRRVTPATS